MTHEILKPASKNATEVNLRLLSNINDTNET